MQKCTDSGFWIVNKRKYFHVLNSTFVNTSSFKYCTALMDFLYTDLFCYFAVKFQNVLQNGSMVIECYCVSSTHSSSNEASNCILMLNTIVRKPNYFFFSCSVWISAAGHSFWITNQLLSLCQKEFIIQKIHCCFSFSKRCLKVL